MPAAPRRVLHACPRCYLSLEIVTTNEGVKVEYDVAEWARICANPNSGSPLVCPSVRHLLETWLGKP